MEQLLMLSNHKWSRNVPPGDQAATSLFSWRIFGFMHPYEAPTELSGLVL